MKIRKKIQLYREFGFKVAFASFCSSAFRYPIAITRWKDKVMLDWLKKNYAHVIQKYKNLPENNNSGTSNIIWTSWWQGEDNAPEIVKKCFESVRHNCGSRELKVITKENFSEYLDIPEHVMEKLYSGMITLTHLSDILRMVLLYKYGGMWLDATVLVTKKIPDEIFSLKYFTVKAGLDPKCYGVSLRRWTSFIQAAQKESKLCGFVFDVHLEYWKEHDIPIDYVLLAYIIALAYEEFTDFRNLLDALPLNNTKVNDLQPLLNSPFDEKKFEELTSSTMFFKLTWKHKFEKNILGAQTFYGKIIESDFSAMCHK